MTFDKFTIKAQEAVQEAVNIAQRNGQQTIEPVHLLSGILEKATDVTNYIFQKLGMNGQQIAMLLRRRCNICLVFRAAVSRTSATRLTRY